MDLHFAIPTLFGEKTANSQLFFEYMSVFSKSQNISGHQTRKIMAHALREPCWRKIKISSKSEAPWFILAK